MVSSPMLPKGLGIVVNNIVMTTKHLFTLGM